MVETATRSGCVVHEFITYHRKHRVSAYVCVCACVCECVCVCMCVCVCVCVCGTVVYSKEG